MPICAPKRDISQKGDKTNHMEIRRMKLKDLHPADYNPRVQLKEGDPEYEALKTSLETNGTVVPLVWNETTGRVVGGHQRLAVLQKIGAKEVEVSVVHMDEKQEKQANIALNRIEGEWDEAKLRELFKEFDEEEIFTTGFSEAELRAMYPEGLEEALGAGDSEEPEPEDEQEEDSGEDGEPESKEFTVFLSFPSKERAEEWLESEGYEPEFSAGRTMIIKMGGENDGD